MRVVYKFIQLLLLRNYVALSYVTSYRYTARFLSETPALIPMYI